MKRKWLILILVLVCLLSGCCTEHQWQDATCEFPKICTKCKKREGERLPHTWAVADCQVASVCTVCGEERDAVQDHQWQEADCTAPKTCTVCAVTEGEPLGHDLTVTAMKEDSREGICKTCSNLVKEAVADWAALAEDAIAGTWTGVLIEKKDELFYTRMDAALEAEFSENGEARVLMDTREYRGRWEFKEVGTSWTGEVSLVYTVNLNLPYEFTIMAMDEFAVADTPLEMGCALRMQTKDGILVYNKAE